MASLMGDPPGRGWTREPRALSEAALEGERGLEQSQGLD